MKKRDTNTSPASRASTSPRSLPIHEWPDADRRAWEDACRPGTRLQPGGTACYLAAVSRHDFANRYRAVLGFLQRSGRLPQNLDAAAQVTLPNVEDYIAELTARVRSVTVYNCVYKLRRAAELLASDVLLQWVVDLDAVLDVVIREGKPIVRTRAAGLDQVGS